MHLGRAASACEIYSSSSFLPSSPPSTSVLANPFSANIHTRVYLGKAHFFFSSSSLFSPDACTQHTRVQQKPSPAVNRIPTSFQRVRPLSSPLRRPPCVLMCAHVCPSLRDARLLPLLWASACLCSAKGAKRSLGGEMRKREEEGK